MSNKEVERLFELEKIKNEKEGREFIADACFVEIEYAKADYDFLLESVEDTFAMEIEATHKELAGETPSSFIKKNSLNKPRK